MLSVKKVCFILFLFSFLSISTSSLAQDSLEVSVLDRMFNNFDSIQEIYHNGYYFDIIANATDIFNAYQRYDGDVWDFSHFSTEDTIYSMCFENNSRYLANNDAGLSMYNHMGVLHSFPEYGKCLDVKVNESIAYIATDRGFYVLNTSDISSPVLLDSLVSPDGFKMVLLNGNYAYTIAPDLSLAVIDVADNENISLQQTIDLDVEVYSIQLHSNCLYILSPTDGIFIYSLADPAVPTLLNHPSLFEMAYYMSVRNDTAWVACGDDGIHIIDISDPEHLEQISSFRMNAKWNGIFDNFLYINDNEEYITILNNENVDSLYFINYYGNNHIVDFVHDGDYYAFACDDVCGLTALDVQVPEYISGYHPFGNLPCRRVAIEDTFSATITIENEIELFHTWYMGYGGVRSTIELDSKGTDLQIKDEILTVSLENGGFKNYSIATMSEPVLISEINVNINATGFDIDNGIICLVNDNGELHVYDQSIPDQTPVLLSSVSIAEICHEVLIHQGFAFVACDEEGIKVVDLYDPANPEVVTTIDTDGTAYDITIGGWYFYIADGLNGVRVYDIHSPYSPQLVGYYDTPGNALRVFAWHENCGVADEDEFIVLRYAFATDVPESDLPADFRIESVYPNPFNPNCNVKINIPVSGFMSLKVFNTLGQEVSSLSKTPVNAGSFEYQFFGKNHASGVYILQVELEGYGVQTSKMVLMK